MSSDSNRRAQAGASEFRLEILVSREDGPRRVDDLGIGAIAETRPRGAEQSRIDARAEPVAASAGQPIPPFQPSERELDAGPPHGDPRIRGAHTGLFSYESP
jgi:hypothetical protein